MFFIGVLKARWRILLDERKMRYSRERMIQIINVCTALHNICVENNIPLDEQIIADDQSGSQDAQLPRSNISSIGSNIRDELKLAFL